MPTPILMPALSPTMTEGTLAKWHKKEGETVSAGDVLAEIETDKATMEVEAVDEGVVGKIIIGEGTGNVKVNELIAVLLEDGEKAEDIDVEALKSETPDTVPAEEEKSASKQDTQAAQANGAAEVPHSPPSQSQSASSPGERIFASPLAKRMAEERGINLAAVQGSGPRGRIIKRDIESHQGTAGAGAAAMAGAYGKAQRQPNGMPVANARPNSTMRKAIARRLTQSKQQLPHFYLTIECRIDKLLGLRKSLNKKGEKQGYKISVNDFVILACAHALTEVPEANASWQEEAVQLYTAADVAVAVAIDEGLITPIIQDAQAKSIVAISKEMKDLALRARSGQLKPNEYEGGTFTVSNLGMYGIDEFSAIINPPQGAILAVGQGVQKPMFDDKGNVVAATMMKATLSVDHRAIDGAVGAEFMKVLREYLEDPAMLLV